jgi:hypothetical protein
MKWARIWTEYDYDSWSTGRLDFDAGTREEAEVLTREWLGGLPSRSLDAMGSVMVLQVGDEFTAEPAEFSDDARRREAEADAAERRARDETEERAEYERLRAKFGG